MGESECLGQVAPYRQKGVEPERALGETMSNRRFMLGGAIDNPCLALVKDGIFERRGERSGQPRRRLRIPAQGLQTFLARKPCIQALDPNGHPILYPRGRLHNPARPLDKDASRAIPLEKFFGHVRLVLSQEGKV
jgi:hypothetical protein